MRHTIQTRIQALELFIKCENNFTEFETSWRQMYFTDPPSRKTVLRLLHRFRSSGNIGDLKRSGRKRTRNEDLIVAIGAYFSLNENASVNSFLEENGEIASSK